MIKFVGSKVQMELTADTYEDFLKIESTIREAQTSDAQITVTHMEDVATLKHNIRITVSTVTRFPDFVVKIIEAGNGQA